MTETAAAPEELKQLSPPCTHVAHAWLTAEVYALLELEANDRREHPDRLAAVLLTALLRRGRAGAVLARAEKS